MTVLRQSTARTILVGPVLDSDGVAKTDEVVASIKVTKNGTVGAAHGSTTLTHDHAGKYKLAMNAGDPDTVGVLEVSLNSGTNDMPVARFNVVEEAVFDAMYAAAAAGPLQSTTAGRKLTVSATGVGDADVVSLADGTYKVADTTGPWATAGTWASGVAPAAGDNIIIRNGVTVTIAASLDLGQFGTLELQGSAILNVAAGQTVATVPRGWVIAINYGTITSNHGTVEINNTGATITSNFGLVIANGGTITINDWRGGVVTTNDASSTITSNISEVVSNYGTITVNDEFGRTVNYGTVATNDTDGFVVNYGTITTNASGGVVVNYATIGTNNGTSTTYDNPDAAGTAPTAIENRQEMDSNSTELAKIGTIPALDSGAQTIGAAIAKLADDNGGASYNAEIDSLNAQSLNATAQAALEDQFDGTGLIGDAFPLRQDQGASIAGGLAVQTVMASVTVIQGSQQDLANANTSNNVRWTGDDDGAGAEFIFLCTPADADSQPGDLHFEGYYDEPTGATNSATLETYNFLTASWEVHETLLNATSDQMFDLSLHSANRAPGSGTVETVAHTIGDVLIKFQQTVQETGNAALLIDLMTVGFISSPVTAAEIVDEWETQSQADPTGFHVNVLELNSVSQSLLDLVDFADEGYDPGTNKVQGVVLVDTITTYTGNTKQTGNNFTRLGGPAGASVSADIADLPTVSEFNTRTIPSDDYFVVGDYTVPDAAGTAAGLHTTTDGLVTTVDTVVAGIKLVTDNLPNSGAPTAITTDTARLTAARAAILTDWINGGRLDLILDAILAMLDGARTEPGQGAPAVNPDAMTKLDYLYKAWRNKSTQTASEHGLYNDAGDTVDQKATISDDGTTATKGEVISGP